MRNIQLNKTNFQLLFFIWHLIIGFPPIPDTPPFVFVSPALKRRRTIERAARRFELKKQGRAR